jgi:thioredoxin 2
MPEAQVVPCAACGTMNRVPPERVGRGREPVCGRCKTPLFTYSKPLTVTDSTFASEVERSPLPVLVDMWAPWCGPCQMIAPVIEQLAAEMAGRVRVTKINIDANPATATRFDVRSIPAMLVFKAGREVDRIIGVQPKSEIARRLERVIT